MRNKLLILIGVFMLPVVSFGQTVLYNKGKMAVVSTDNTKTTLYIGGNLVSGRDATDPNVFCDIYLKNSKTVLTGDLIHDAAIGTTTARDSHVFSYDTGAAPTPSLESNSVIAPPGVQSNPSILEFRNITKAQKVTTSTAFNYDWKTRAYIKFPSVTVSNKQHVTVDHKISSVVQTMALDTGRFVLDSERVDPDPMDPTKLLRTSIAHLYMPKNAAITYNKKATPAIGWKDMFTAQGNKVTNYNTYGAIQVNLTLDDPAQATANAKKGRSFIGMGSPYKSIQTDYFMWNFLFVPNEKGEFLTNNNPSWWNPRKGLEAGKGFAISIDLRGTNPTDYIYDLEHTLKGKGLDFAQRVTQKYQFSRFAFHNVNSVYRITDTGIAPPADFKTDIDNAVYTNEVINLNDVVLDVKEGWNFYSNPFLTPLSLANLVQPVGAGTTKPAADWNVNIGTGGTGDIVNRVWIMSPYAKASSQYEIKHGSEVPIEYGRILANYTYLVMLPLGSTSTITADNRFPSANVGTEYTIAPLQMFVLHGENGVNKTITIPTNQRVISGTTFLRSATAVNTDKNDDFLFEVYDKESQQISRTSIVLRENKAIMNSTHYKDIKKLTAKHENNPLTKSVKSVMLEGVIEQTAGSHLYTKNEANNDALEVKFLGYSADRTETSTPLYLTPSLVKQNVRINAYRLNTMDIIKGVFLVDNLVDPNKRIPITEDKPYYDASINPTDSPNRFTLIFTRSVDGIGPEDTDDDNQLIYAHYKDNDLKVSGFQMEDYGSKLSVYNIQGRLLHQTSVEDNSVNIRETLLPGVYLVKVVGNKSHVAKFIVK